MIKFLMNVWFYLQGNLRYKLFYSNFAKLIPWYIHQQIVYRINSMDQKCFDDGQCKMCGCATTALQMSNKACPKPCYPSMLSKKVWKKIVDNPNMCIKDKEGRIWLLRKEKFIRYE